jgi:hypothetical protein
VGGACPDARKLRKVSGKPKRDPATSEDGPGKGAYLGFSYELNNELATQENFHESHSISPNRAVGSRRGGGPGQRLRRQSLLWAAGSNAKLTAASRSAAALAAALYATEAKLKRPHMRMSPTVIVLAGIAAVGLTSPALRAGSIARLHVSATESLQPGAESVAYRRCMWRNGERHCRWIAGRRSRLYRNRSRGSSPQAPNLPPNLGWGL